MIWHIWNTVLTSIAERAGSNSVRVPGTRSRHCRFAARILGGVSSVIAVASLALAFPHANVSSNSNAATLVSNDLAKRSALHEARELLGAVDVKRVCLDFHAPVDTRGALVVGRVVVGILGILCRLV